MKKKLIALIGIIIILSFMLLPVAVYAKLETVINQQAQSFTGNINGTFRGYKYKDLGVNDGNYRCETPAAYYELTCYRFALWFGDKKFATFNMPTGTGTNGTGTTWCARWKGINTDTTDRYRFAYVAKINNSKTISGTTSLLSEE